MTITLPDEIGPKAASAGYDSAEQYVLSLIQEDEERRKTLRAIEQAKRGEGRPIAEVDAQIRHKLGLRPYRP